MDNCLADFLPFRYQKVKNYFWLVKMDPLATIEVMQLNIPSLKSYFWNLFRTLFYNPDQCAYCHNIHLHRKVWGATSVVPTTSNLMDPVEDSILIYAMTMILDYFKNVKKMRFAIIIDFQSWVGKQFIEDALEEKTIKWTIVEKIMVGF